MKDLLNSPLVKNIAKGDLPEIKVQATLSRETIVNMAIATMIVMVFGMIIYKISK